MPCCSWTTGSPTRSSDRSRSIASTLLRRPASRRDRRTTPGVELGLGDDGEPRRGPVEARVQRAHAQHRRRVARGEARPVVGQRQVEAVLGEVLLHRLAAAGALGGDQHARRWRRRRSASARPADRRRGGRPAPGAAARVGGGRRRVRRGVSGAAAAQRGAERLERAEERVGGQEQLGGRQQRPRAVAAQQPPARLGVLPEVRDRVVDVAVQRDDRAGGQVVGERGRRVEEQRQVVLDAARRDAVADVLVQRRLRRVALEGLAEAAAEARARRRRRAGTRAPAAAGSPAPGRACAACRRRRS